MRRRRDHHNGGLSDRHISYPVHNAYPTNIRPLRADFVDQSLETGNEVLFVCLVSEKGNILAPSGVVTCGTAEEHDGAAIGLYRPPVRRVDGRLRFGDGKPCISFGPVLRVQHEPIVARESRLGAWPALGWVTTFATIGTVGEGYESENGPLEPDALLPAQDRLWRHPAERGAEQAAANLAARQSQGRSWPALVMSFLAGCCAVGLAWMLADNDEPAPIEQVSIQEIIPEQPAFEGTLSFDDWVDQVSQLNKTSVVALHLGGDASHDVAQAVLLRDDGHLMTSAHAIVGAEDITAEFPGGRLPAQLIGSDPVSGVAVLKINSPNLSPPTFGDESQVVVRDRLVALSYTTSEPEAAIAVDLIDKNYVTTVDNGDLLSELHRLSDDLSPEWAGSAILSDDGGIVAMAITGRDGSPFAIPIDAARSAADQIISNGEVEHKAWLGVNTAPALSEALQEQRGLSGGVLISKVWGETPAARAGLRAGDVITRAGSVNVLGRTDLGEALATLEAGEPIEITYSRVTEQAGDTNVLRDPNDVESELFTTMVIIGARPA